MQRGTSSLRVINSRPILLRRGGRGEKDRTSTFFIARKERGREGGGGHRRLERRNLGRPFDLGVDIERKRRGEGR